MSTEFTNEIILLLDKVSRQYGGVQGNGSVTIIHALRDVDLELKHGERVAVMGPSGSGKSTLLNVIAGLDKISAGSIHIDGKDLSRVDDDERTRLRRERIGMIFQSFNLLPTLTAVENVSLPLRLRGVSRSESEQQARAMLERVGLAPRGSHRPDEMSGGERQRIAIARALVFNPLLLLADEPTGNLDSVAGGTILTLLDELHRDLNTTILLVTHNEMAAAGCDRILSMRDGRIVDDKQKRLAADER